MSKSLLFAAAALLVLQAGAAQAQGGHITTPKEALGHELGEDYFLASYSQLESYWKTLASQSDRAKLVEIGKTAEGRPQYMMIVSSPENMRQLDKYRDISRRLAKAEGLTPDQAHALAKEGKTVVWIDGGLHAAEVEPAQALMLAVYKALSDNDPEWMRLLDDNIILFVQDNPDGQDLLANWYMRNPDPTKRVGGVSTVPNALAGTPQLYHHYIGHDNNRDFYMSSQPESTNINRVAFREWFPQIIYNHHQTGPRGAVVFMPPFRDPFNYAYDPLIMTELSEAGAAMHSRLVAEDKPGSTMRSGAAYSTWFNGSLRTISYFHNAIGILTEIIGNPTPMPVPLVARSQLPRNDIPMPVAPQTWHLSQSIAYSMSMNRSLLDYASRNRERLLFNIYKMGADQIAAGSRDSWTTTSQDIERLEAAAKGKTAPPEGGIDAGLYQTVLRDPARRDPRGYVISPDQPDFPTAVKFLNTLIKTGVTVQKATAAFDAGGKHYPAGSYVVPTAQAYRPHVLDMFEPQHHPQDFEYPGGPPIRPYDTTGYTLAVQMGVKFDRLLEGFSGPFTPVNDLIAPTPVPVAGTAKAGWLISHQINDGFIVTNRLAKAKAPVFWVDGPTTVAGQDLGRGAIWIPAGPKAKAIVERAAAELGVTAYGVDKAPAGKLIAVKTPRIALVDVYGGSMPSGWSRWLFEQFEFPFTVVYPGRLDAGSRKKDFDVVLLPDDVGIDPHNRARPLRPDQQKPPGQPKAEDIPAQYRPWLGLLTAEKTAPQLAAFLKAGGTVIAVGDATGVGEWLKTPTTDPLTEEKDGKPQPLPSTKFYVPGSVLEARIDQTTPFTFGLPERGPLFFDSSPVFGIAEGARATKTLAGFDSETPLLSGWAFGQKYLKGTSAIVDTCLGGGHLLLMGTEVNQRAQSQANFKFLFNGLLYGPTASAAQACR
ncbi:MAG TPA: M14 metallopeptidase family protein [Phenylobacterium sp.]